MTEPHDKSRIESTSAGDRDEVLRIVEEVTDLAVAGDEYAIERLLASHPEHAAEIERVLPAIRMIQEVKPGPAMTDSTNAVPEDRASATTLRGRLGDFQLIREIGRGGMGIVYEAEQLLIGRRVAVKVLPRAAMLDQRQLARFQNEARAAATLNHSHIVPLYSVGIERGIHYYAMLLVEGQSLSEAISGLQKEARPALSEQDPPAASKEVCNPASDTTRLAAAPISTLRSRSRKDYHRAVARIGVQVAEALEHAHTRGIIHRDIKPANILLDAAGDAQVTDFGLARFDGTENLTLTGDVVGTLRYSPPEQVLGQHGLAVDQRADIYSLGTTLYELLALQPAFDADTSGALLQQITRGRPRTLRSLDPLIPADLETIVHKAMEVDVADRYPTASELVLDLRRYLDDKPIRARRPTLLACARKWTQRHRVAVCATVASVLVTLTVSTLLLTRAWQRERDLRQASDANLALARESLDEFFSRLASAPRGRLVISEEDRDELLAKGTELYQRLLEARGDDREQQLAVSEEYDRQARLYALADNDEAAAEALKTSIELQKQVVRELPADEQKRWSLFGSLLELGSELTLRKQHPQADEAFVEAQQQMRTIDGQSPSADPKVIASEMFLFSQQAMNAAMQGNYVLAEQFARKRIAHAESLVEMRGESAIPAVLEARMPLTHYLARQDRRDEAISFGEQTIAECVAFLKTEAGKNKPLRHSLSMLHGIVGTVGGESDELASAEHHFRQSLYYQRMGLPGIGYRGLGPRQPPAVWYATREHHQLDDARSRPEAFGGYAEEQLSLAQVLIRRGRLIEGERMLGEVFYVMRQLAVDWPNLAGFQSLFAEAASEVGRFLHANGRADAGDALRVAAAAWQDLSRNHPTPEQYAEGKLVELRREFPHVLGNDKAEKLSEAFERFAAETAFYNRALGQIYLTAGSWEAAVERLQAATNTDDGGLISDWLQLAIAEQHRGNRESARQWFSRAQVMLDAAEQIPPDVRDLRRRTAIVVGRLESPSTAETDWINFGDQGPRFRLQALSGDGTTLIAANYRGHGYRWTREEGLVRLPNAAGKTKNTPRLVSFDGSFVVGRLSDPSPSLNYRWSLDTGMQLIDDLPGFATHTVYGLSPDGRYVIGRSSTKPDASRNRRRACWIWSAETGTRVISETSTTTPRYVSPDSRVVVFSDGSRWSEGEGHTAPLDVGSEFRVSKVVKDGQTLLGRVKRDGCWLPALWTSATGLRELGRLDSFDLHDHLEATASTSDGTIVVGHTSISKGHLSQRSQRAVLWHDDPVALDLESELRLKHGQTNLHRWGLCEITAISADGRVIAGHAWQNRARGHTPTEAWILFLSRPLGSSSS